MTDADTLDFNKYRSFNIEKIIQVFAYIQKHAGTQDKLEIIKYLFFADRLNLRRHFFLISMDIYYALKLGPVASNSLNVLNKEDDYLNYSESELNLLNKININGRNTRIIKETNMDLLSKNEINSLDFVIDIFQGKPILALSHEYPEWKRYKTLFDARKTSTEKIHLEDFFTNPILSESPLLQLHFGKDPFYEDEEYLEEAKQFYFEGDN